MAGTPIAGYSGTFKSGGVSLNLEKWSITGNAGDIPTTNFNSEGYKERISGIVDAEVTASGFFDADANPLDDPPSLSIGAIVTEVVCGANDDLTATFTGVLITKCMVSDDVNGRVEFSFTGVSTGAFTLFGVDGNANLD